MPISVTVPDELAGQVPVRDEDLPEILRLGLREWHARKDSTFAGLGGVLETLASLPAPETVLALRPSPAALDRLEELLEKNRSTGLSPQEQREWESFQFVEHLIRLAKAQALLKLKAT